MIDLRLVAYTPLGASLGVLPDALTYTFTDPDGSDLSTLKIEYPQVGRKFPLLESRPEVAVEWFNPATNAWVEPFDARLHVVKRSWNSKDDGLQARQYDAVGIGWLGRKARVWTGGTMNSEGKRQFNAATPGTMIGTVFDDAKARGWGPNLTRSFTATLDSAGQPWATTATLAFDPSGDLHGMIAALVDQGLCDVAWSGRTLNLYNADTFLGRDLTTGLAPVWIRHLDGITSAPEEGTIEDLITAARLVGDTGATWDVTNPAAPTTYGRLEGYVTQSGVTDEGTANLLIEQQLLDGEAEKVQYTREWDSAAAKVVPFVNYRPGDWAFVDREDAGTLSRERSRIVQVSLTRDAEGGVSGHTTLGTRLDDLLTKLARRTSSVTGGANAGGAGGAPSPAQPDGRTPAAAAGLVGSTDAYLDSMGRPQARVALDWANVTADGDGVLMSIRGYEVWRSIDAGVTYVKVTDVVNSDVSLSPLQIGQAQVYRVRAVSEDYVTGPWSNTVALTTASDLTPPPKPSNPVLASRLGMVSVSWDGKTSTGAAMPLDFSRCDVYVITTAYPSGINVGTVNLALGSDSMFVPREFLPTVDGATVSVYLRPYDTSRNPGPDSNTITVTVQRITGPDIAANAVTANAIQAGAIDGMVITGAVVQTLATALRGIKLNAAGFNAYDNAGTRTVFIDPTTGIFQAVNGSGNGVQIASNLVGGSAGGSVSFVSGATRTADIFSVGGALSLQTTAGQIYLWARGADFTTDTFLRMNSGGSGAGIELAPGTGGKVTVSRYFEVDGSTATIDTTGNTFINVGGAFQVKRNDQADYGLLINNGVRSKAIVNLTTTAAANVRINPDDTIATLARSTSRRDAKLVIEELTAADVMPLLDVQVSTWIDRGDAERYAAYLSGDDDDALGMIQAPLTRIPGVVAEDVEAKAGSLFVDYDLTGKVQGVFYDRIGVAWIPLVRDLMARIATLEEERSV